METSYTLYLCVHIFLYFRVHQPTTTTAHQPQLLLHYDHYYFTIIIMDCMNLGSLYYQRIV